MKKAMLGMLAFLVVTALIAGPAQARREGGSGGGSRAPSDMHGPPGDIGPPAAMLKVSGWAYYDYAGELWKLKKYVWDGTKKIWKPTNTIFTVDFGPEFYTPYECLEAIFDQAPDYDEGDEFYWTIGVWEIAVFICSGGMSGGWCPWGNMTVASDDGDKAPMGGAYIKLAYERPDPSGEWVKVYGREGEEVRTVLVWEINYGWDPKLYEGDESDPGEWYWWRGAGQPWMKVELLSCSPMGGEE